MSRAVENGVLLTFGVLGLVTAAGLLPTASRSGSRALSAADGQALQGILVLLRVLQIGVQEGHWTVKGSNYYGDHLLLQRIYTSVDDEIDGIGERIVAYAGPSYVDSDVITAKANTVLRELRKRKDPIQQALAAEEMLQVALRKTYDALKASGGLSLGLDDFLMGIASAHDTNRYLLQQRLAG
jgi:DNA-binding ferritin-like protein